jgi:phage baseplate assembly protein W
MAADPKAFLGVGWSYPPAVEGDGTLSLAAYEEDVRQAIRIILGTEPGERVMRPTFGAGLRAFVFEPINTSTISRLESRVRDALITWEPRIDVRSVTVTPDTAQAGRLLVEIEYLVRATNALQNLVYPFYLQEGR